MLRHHRRRQFAALFASLSRRLSLYLLSELSCVISAKARKSTQPSHSSTRKPGGGRLQEGRKTIPLRSSTRALQASPRLIPSPTSFQSPDRVKTPSPLFTSPRCRLLWMSESSNPISGRFPKRMLLCVRAK